MKTIEDIVECFQYFDSWEDRYRYLIDLGRQLPPMPEDLRIPDNIVVGCLSQVWLVAVVEDDDTVSFVADSDSAIVRGLISLVVTTYNRKSPADIVKTDILDIFSRIGFEQHLSPNRRNGFVAMVGRVKALAMGAVHK